MCRKCKNKLRSVLFTLAGAVIGLAYYVTVGCAGGSCAITASPVRSVVYMAVIGWLLSVVLAKGPGKTSETRDEA